MTLSHLARYERGERDAARGEAIFTALGFEVDIEITDDTAVTIRCRRVDRNRAITKRRVREAIRPILDALIRRVA